MTDLSFSKDDPDPIATAVATSDPTQFFDALRWIECKTRMVKDRKLPRSLLMIRFLGTVELEREFECSLYVRAQLGPYLPDAAAFCREIGATRFADVLARVVALFPDGMPAGLREYSQAGGCWGGKLAEPIKRLDGELAEWYPELASALRDWLGANRAQIQGDIDRITRLATSGPGSPARAAGLDEVLATTDPDPLQAGFAFLREARDWVTSLPGRDDMEVKALPETARMVVLLDELTSAINSSGLLYVADWELGNHFADLQRWAALIGATRTGAYLAGLAALFPRRRVPKNRDKRAETLQAVVTSAVERGPDPLDALDDEFRESAMLEIPTRLREWMTANRAAVLAEA